jgi:hypothetical protein
MRREHDYTQNPLHSLTRLAIGSMLIAHDELQRQMRVWENETESLLTEQRRRHQEFSAWNQPGSQYEAPPALPTADKPADTMRYALIGMLFEAQTRLTPRAAPARPNPLDKAAAPLMEAFRRTPWLAPVRERFDDYTARGEREVNRWIARGRAEEYHSRALIQTAAQVSFETSVHTVAQNPEVRELVQEHGTSLANEVIEEVRERAVSTDKFLERLVRTLLRRPPREELPEPPEMLRKQVETHGLRPNEI